jgi:TolB-like protein/DNA-binding winged helix-turn-helix (wHTH) protein/Flp pilus assembly protein TadD
VLSESCNLAEFGPFRLDPEHRTLWRGAAAVPLSSRAFDILLLLVEHRGRVVTKDEILTTVWRGMIVEENNLAVQVSALRRALAEGCDAPVILTVPGQGYRFVGTIARAAEPVVVSEPAAEPIGMPAQVVAAAPPPVRRRRWEIVGGAVAGGILVLAAAVLLLRPAPPPAAPRLSIAVLPFRDLSDDRCCDYLADAISDDLTTDLSHIPGSVVIARESSDAFRGRAVPTAELGHTLNVRYLLEGSVRAVDGLFSINAQLIEASSGGHLWAERFTVPRAKLGEAQDSIVRRLGSALGVTLVDIEGARAARERAADPDALDLFLHARSVLDRSDTLEALEQAQGLLEQAVEKQPNDVKVLSELAWVLATKANNFVDPHHSDDVRKADEVAARAFALAPGSPNVLAAFGVLMAFRSGCGQAEHLFDEALTHDPSNLRALTGSIFCYGNQARFDDMATRLVALLRVDPEGPHRSRHLQQLGFAYLMTRRQADALPVLDRALAGMGPPGTGEDLGTEEWARLSLVAAARLAGETARANDAMRTYRAAWPVRSTWMLQAYTPKNVATSAGFQRVLGALREAGLPAYLDENADWGLAPALGATRHGMVGPTPTHISGIETLRTATVMARMKSEHPPVVLDFGAGAALPDGARLIAIDPTDGNEIGGLAQSLRGGGRDIVVMGTNALDWRGLTAAARLAAASGDKVYWYRGGEEAWVEAGLKAQDVR